MEIIVKPRISLLLQIFTMVINDIDDIIRMRMLYARLDFWKESMNTSREATEFII